MTSSFSRREFVKSSAAIAAGGLALPGVALPAFARSVHVAHTETLRVGLVGCGGRGTGAASQAMSAGENIILSSMGDAFAERIDASRNALAADETLAPKIKVRPEACYAGIDAYKQVIDSDVDVVILTAPPVFRPAHLRYAIEKGKHVFAEKPVAVDAPGVRHVIESARLAKEQNLTLVCGFCWRHAQHMRDTYAEVHGGRIGEVLAVQSQYNTGPLGDVPRAEGMSDMEWQLRNWKAFIHLSGDHIVEQAVHSIDWIDWAFNGEPPARCFAVGGRAARSGEWTGNMYDHFAVVYEWTDGRRGYHMCRQIANASSDNNLTMLGTKGRVEIDPWAPRCTIAPTPSGAGESWRWNGQRNDMYQQEHDELFASIRAGAGRNDGEWLARSTLLAIMAREAAYTGQTITWDQIMNSQKDLTPASWDFGPAPFPPVPVPGVEKFA